MRKAEKEEKRGSRGKYREEERGRDGDKKLKYLFSDVLIYGCFFVISTKDSLFIQQIRNNDHNNINSVSYSVCW